jgi:hypothetical protein
VPGNPQQSLEKKLAFIPTTTGWLNDRRVFRIEKAKDGELWLLDANGDCLAVTHLSTFDPDTFGRSLHDCQ